MSDQQSPGKRAKALNDTISYTVWSVFKVRTSLPADGRDAIAAELGYAAEEIAALRRKGVLAGGG